MMTFTTETRIAVANPRTVVDLLCEHIAEHGATVSFIGDDAHIAFGPSRGRLSTESDCLAVWAEAPDLIALQEIKLSLASHIVEFASAETVPEIVWTGDGADLSTPADFRVLTVRNVETLTPHMRRIIFQGEDLARFDTLEALHVRLFIPPPGLTEPVWPTLGRDGLLKLPVGDERPAVRKYTIRKIDVAAGTLQIDFVLHDDAGPGSAFAAHAKVGDRVGMAGPGGRGLRPAEWYAFLADETALPAVGRMLESLPTHARGVAVLEVESAAEEQQLTAPPGIEIRWLHRNGARAGTTTLLQDTFAAMAWPSEDGRLYLWAAMERSSFKAVRAAARQHPRLHKDDCLIVSYWRLGIAEEQHAREKAAVRPSD